MGISLEMELFSWENHLREHHLKTKFFVLWPCLVTRESNTFKKQIEDIFFCLQDGGYTQHNIYIYIYNIYIYISIHD